MNFAAAPARRLAARLACGCALAALTPVAALAQAAPPVEEASAEGEIIVMGTIAQAQAASIEAKRAALNLVDVAAADAVGRFPDQNSAAALSRLPAVAVQRDQGQERYIQVRGAPNRWTSVTIDGIPIIGVDEGGDTRAFRFDAVPAVMLSALAINKTLTPALPSDAIVASIDLQTYNPMARKGLHVSADLGYGFMNHGKGEQRQGSLRLSWSNDTFGVVIGGSHYRRKQLTDNREVGLYDEPSSAADTTFGPTEIDFRLYEIERWNNGLFAGLEFQPEEGRRFFAKAIFTEFSDDEQRNAYELQLDRAASGFRNLASGDLVNVPLRGSFNYGEYRNRNIIGTLGAEIENDSGFFINLKGNYARTENTSYLPLVRASTSGLASPSLTYDRSDPRFPLVTLYQTLAGPTAGTFVRGAALGSGFNQATLNPASAIMIGAAQETISDSYTVKLDLGQQLGSVKLEGGVLFADRTIAGNNFSLSNVVALGALGGTVGLPFDVNSYVTTTPWTTQFPLGFTLNLVNNRAMRADIDKLLAALQAAGRYDAAANTPLTDRYAQKERTLAGYFMATAELGNATIVGGVRVENYRLTNSGSARIGAVFTPLTVKQNVTDFFPSINARVPLADDLIFRFGAQRGISRPAYGAIRVGSTINDATSPGVISGGNPGLQAEYTWGVDTSLEFYLPGEGIAAVSAFYRWVDNVFYQNTQPVGSAVFNTGTIDRSNYRLTSTFNGENGKLYGVEFNYQQRFAFLPAPFDGLGFQGNLTLLGGSFDTQLIGGVQNKGIAFQGMSRTIANASLFYEKSGLSARVSYQWRSDWLDSLGGFGAGESRKGYANLDASVRYAVTDTLTLFVDAANLTNEKYIAYEGSMARPSEVEQIGARYLFGARFNF